MIIDKIRKSEGVCRASNGETGALWSVKIFDVVGRAGKRSGGGDEVHPGPEPVLNSSGDSNWKVCVGDAADSIAWSNSSPRPLTHPCVLMTSGTRLVERPCLPGRRDEMSGWAIS